MSHRFETICGFLFLCCVHVACSANVVGEAGDGEGDLDLGEEGAAGSGGRLETDGRAQGGQPTASGGTSGGVSTDGGVEETADAKTPDPGGSGGSGDAMPAETPVLPGKLPMFVAVGRGGRRIMSCDGGRTWVANQFVSTQDGEHSTFTPKGLAYGDGTFVFLSGWGNPSTTWVTNDGVTWLEQKHQAGFAGIGFDEGQFVLVGGNYHEGSKDNGRTWTRLSPPRAPLGREAAAFPGAWAAGSDGQAQVLRRGSASWSGIPGCSGSRHGGIGADGGFAASPSVLISVGSNGDVCGINLSTGAAIGASRLNASVAGKPNYGAGNFMVATGDSIRFSKDGVNWQSRALPRDIRIDLIDCHGNGVCAGISTDGKSFHYSDDGITWKRASAPQGNGMVALKAGMGAPSNLCKLP